MTAIAAPFRRLATGGSGKVRIDRAELPPLRGGTLLTRTLLVVLFAATLGLVVQLVFVSALQQRAAQQQLFDRFRADVAAGTAPVGPTDGENRVLGIGAPVSYVEIPAIGVRQVVVEGTTPRALFDGPGHRRDTPLPGQVGVSVIYGRKAAFGGPFARLGELEEGDRIDVTTGQGTFAYEVLGVRRAGDPIPPPISAGEARLVLVTADGAPFLPSDVLRVDADLVGEAQPGNARLLTPQTLPADEETMAADTGQLWVLALWLQVMVLLAVGAVWAWYRRGRAFAWVVFVPPFLLVGMYVANQTAELLPNLL